MKLTLKGRGVKIEAFFQRNRPRPFKAAYFCRSAEASMDICIQKKELEAALAEICNAEKNGFNYCVAVFKIDGVVKENPQEYRSLEEILATYSDLWERAHPTSGALNFGRGQNLSRRCRFDNGMVISIEKSAEQVAEGDERGRE